MPTQTINLNVIPSGVPPIVNVSQNDSGWTILLSLMKGREPFTLSSGYTYTLCGTKPTGTGFSYDDAVAMVGSNVISFNTNTVMTAVAGDVRCGIIIYDGDEHVETLNFILHVQRTALDADTIVDSNDFGSIITQAVVDWMDEHGVVIDDTLSVSGAAADAKKVGDELSELKSAFNDYNAFNIMPKSVISTGTNRGVTFTIDENGTKCVGTASGGVATRGVINSSSVLPDFFEAGESYYVVLERTDDNINLRLTYYFDDSTNSYVTISESQWVTIPDNTVGLIAYVTVANGTTVDGVFRAYMFRAYTNKTLSEKVDEAEADITEFGNNAFDDVNEAASLNRMDANSLVIGWLAKSTGVEETTSTNSGTVGKIKVSAGTEYRYALGGTQLGSTGRYVAFYENAYADITDYDGIITATAVSGETAQYTFTPSSDGYVRVNFYKTWSPRDCCFCESSSWPTYFSEYAAVKSDNPLFGKKIACDGASIMANNGGGYLKYVAVQNGMPRTSLAKGGATIANGTYDAGGTARHWICESISTLPTGYDYYIFDGASNDHGNNVPFGTPAALTDYAPTLDLSTFTGAFEHCCMVLRSTFATAKCGYVFPHRKHTESWWTDTWKPFMIQTLEKWGVPYLDLEMLIPPIGCVDALKAAYTTDGDGTHPTEECYRIFYVGIVEAWLKTL